MRFTNRENNWSAKSCHLAFVVFLLGNCLLSVACQTNERKVAAALKQCQYLLDKDDVQAAGDCYGKAIVANPDSATLISKTGEDAVFKKCIELHDKKNYKQAITCFDATTALKPDNASVYFLLADSYYQYHRANNDGTFDLLDGAEEAIKQGLEIRPDDAELHSLYGDVLSAKGNSTKGLSEYKQAVKIKPKEILFWIELAMAQEKSNNLWEAITSYNQALLINPDETLVLYNVGLLYEKLGEIDKAILAYEKLLKIKTPYDDAEQRLEKLKERREDQKMKPQGEAKGFRKH